MLHRYHINIESLCDRDCVVWTSIIGIHHNNRTIINMHVLSKARRLHQLLSVLTWQSGSHYYYRIVRVCATPYVVPNEVAHYL